MRKIVYLILLLSLLWLAKLSYDVAQYSQIVPQLQQQLTQQQQRYSLLNDQFVAVQRKLQDAHLSDPSEASSLPSMVTGVAPVILIKQQLQLVQFAIDQQQFIYAIDQLNQVQQHIVQYTVSPALQHSLMKAIEQDKQAIQHYVLMQTQQQQQIDTLLQQLDQKLLQEVHNPTIKMQQAEASSWWSWFKFEKVQRTQPDLINRHLILKEGQLRLLLASQALHQGQASEYRKSVQEVIRLLSILPDQNSQTIKQKLEKLLNLSVIPTPKLTTLGLLG
ncbi:hypothetical protein [Acinetobacter modestus]|uniref:BSD domain-containing protein n=1 Tax=Acinetobacter modestus TaxID=1776740 RepID=A0ABN0JSP8_9GAMM|nr:hypothetical protein [Acinetobacter modestus]ENU28382.1 hypothetical protein F992_00500 [Acinetobacter modestus]GGA30943.1 hypothetical protein GCM10017554_30320 [Acinetobacter modestus]